MKRIIVESPFMGKGATDEERDYNNERNIAYAQACCRDCILRDESPYASHLLLTQRGILRDGVPEERNLGMRAGWEWAEVADAIVVYTDLGMSSGMQRAIDRQSEIEFGQPHRVTSKVEMRKLQPKAYAAFLLDWPTWEDFAKLLAAVDDGHADPCCSHDE